jgi:hypothetical protein
MSRFNHQSNGLDRQSNGLDRQSNGLDRQSNANYMTKYKFNESFKEQMIKLATSEEYRESIINIFIESEYDNCLWEFPRIGTDTINNMAEFVLIKSQPFPHADKSAFKDNFDKYSDISVFRNISGDTLLISPNPNMLDFYHKEQCGHVMSFMKYGNVEQKHALLKNIGIQMLKLVNSGQSIYLSTHGYGVPWLHMRLCDKPKYYKNKQYLE